MTDRPTHLLRMPCPIDQVTVWCGRTLAQLTGDALATGGAEHVTCPECLAAMRKARDELLAWEGPSRADGPPTGDLPANITIDLTRTRDGRWRATARATAWPAGLVLSPATTQALAEEAAVRLPVRRDG